MEPAPEYAYILTSPFHLSNKFQIQWFRYHFTMINHFIYHISTYYECCCNEWRVLRRIRYSYACFFALCFWGENNLCGFNSKVLHKLNWQTRHEPNLTFDLAESDTFCEIVECVFTTMRRHCRCWHGGCYWKWLKEQLFAFTQM